MGSRWQPYFPQRAGHNDLVETDMRAYFTEISNFLGDVKKIASGLKVEPPAVVRPPQVEMFPTVQNNIQVEMTPKGAQGAQGNGIPPGEFLVTIAEPKVGPEDGRYDQFRKGNVRMPDATRAQTEKDVPSSREPHDKDQLASASETA